ncbi:MAG: metal-dependent transcriptional regulator [Candidatus Hodarchaeota archaeon]
MSRMSRLHTQEEILEHLWIKLIEEKEEYIEKTVLEKLIENYDADIASTIKDLTKGSDISASGNRISLTNKGIDRGRQIIRRHRLAERLLTDVINLSFDKIERYACSFEHVLNEDVEENICILLGHPKICPHGKKIPPGQCCAKKITTVQSAILSLEDVEAGYEGIISYLATKKHDRLRKLMSFGILPGVPLKVLRKTPGTVIKIDETVIALESDINQSIFLRNTSKSQN